LFIIDSILIPAAAPALVRLRGPTRTIAQDDPRVVFFLTCRAHGGRRARLCWHDPDGARAVNAFRDRR
jgi:hypothetical protein